MPNRTRWTDQEKQALRDHYPAIPYHKLAQALPGRSPGAIIDMAGRMGLQKSHERMAEMGRENLGKHWEVLRGGGGHKAG